MPTMTTLASCSICCETYSSHVRKPVACGQCDLVACAACVCRYLLAQTSDAACMGCRTPWDRSKLAEVLPKGFVNGKLKAWREQVLFEREKAMLPATQPLVAAKRSLPTLEEECAASHKVMRNCLMVQRACHRLSDLKRDEEFNGHRHRGCVKILCEAGFGPLRMETFKNVVAAVQQQTEDAMTNNGLQAGYLWNVKNTLNQGIEPVSFAEYTARRNPRAPQAFAGSYKPTFIRPCPAPECRGFLAATTFACGTCDAKACKSCHELLPQGGADDHICHADNVASAKLLMKDTKPCPKCVVPIYKIDGCDQMWCSSCHTAFSWASGVIETRHVHNPHYYAWMRQNGGMPRAPGDVPPGEAQQPACHEGAGQVVYLTDVILWLNACGLCKDTVVYGRVFALHMLMNHSRTVEIPRYTATHLALNNFDLRIAYLENTMTQKNFRREIQKREKRHQKMQAILHVFDMLVLVLGDLFRLHLRTKTQASAEALCDEATTFLDYTNECFADVAKQFQNCTPFIELKTCQDRPHICEMEVKTFGRGHLNIRGL